MTEARKKRLQEAREWFAQQGFSEDSHVIKAYREHFHVDSACAMQELCMLKVLKPEKQAAYEATIQAKKQKRISRAVEGEEVFSSLQDENFAFIAGYTSGGFPYGITWEEHAELEKNEGKDLNLSEDKPATEEAQSHISSGTGFSGADLYELPF